MSVYAYARDYVSHGGVLCIIRVYYVSRYSTVRAPARYVLRNCGYQRENQQFIFPINNSSVSLGLRILNCENLNGNRYNYIA